MVTMTVKSCYLPYFSWSVKILCSATAAAMREILRLLRFLSNIWGPYCSRLHASRDQIRGSVPIFLNLSDIPVPQWLRKASNLFPVRMTIFLT